MSEELKKDSIDELEKEKNENCQCECDKENCQCSEEKEEEVREEINEIEAIQEEIGKLKAEVEDWKQSYLRKQADFQNFTKRKEREMDELRKFASEKIITKLLDGIDNLTRAEETSRQTNDFEGLVKGVELTLNQFKEVLKSEGLEAIETEGKEFNPEEHMAVMVEANEAFEDNFIIAEFQKGYKLKGKVIRPSMVKVCKK
ncbi:MAG: nucleotide exchange factor GrpE [Fusobacterium perfoetens]|uniref:nucleotide exchange factor GrpE n=1 Tax=Fusobacterium perfoetens TaxID=852 RepID=UPI0023EFC033|nr:nucleotide exchange factor GrpE [Fusobacterium perfoetens]MCI6151899.1 nucleotide exchange factor GrpE [Fusobacterium perfoetens]MDY3238239.1 nucleotide exchange factor GrpE [Fusobacterium perfoetens]